MREKTHFDKELSAPLSDRHAVLQSSINNRHSKESEERGRYYGSKESSISPFTLATVLEWWSIG